MVAFWNSHARAADSPNSRAKGLGTHAYTLGTVTVQSTPQLALFAFKSSATASARKAKFFGELKKIERCA